LASRCRAVARSHAASAAWPRSSGGCCQSRTNVSCARSSATSGRAPSMRRWRQTEAWCARTSASVSCTRAGVAGIAAVTTSSPPAAARRVRESCRARAVPLQEPRDALVERALVLRKARERRGGQNAVPARGALAHAVLPRRVDGDLAFLAEARLLV